MDKSQKKGRQELFHNLFVDGNENGCSAIEEQFIQNQKYAAYRTNGVVMYHEILSLSVHDNKLVTEEMLLDMGRKYLEMRAPKAMAFGRTHFDRNNPHLHLMISGNEVESRKKAWVYKGEFKKIKRELEVYQRKQYPELGMSHVQHGVKSTEIKPQKPAIQEKGRGERERSRRHRKTGNQPSEKERIAQAVRICWQQGGLDGLEAFKTRLERFGLEIYERGKTVGVIDMATGRKHRLKTLGLQDEYQTVVERLKEIPKRVKSFKMLLVEKLKRQVEKWAFSEEVEAVVSRTEEETEEERWFKKLTIERGRWMREREDLRV